MIKFLASGDRLDCTILCIGAHCDDIEIGCGATLRRWVQEYPKATFVWAIFAADSIRKEESFAAAADILAGAAAREIIFFDFEASFFPSRFAEIKNAFESLKKFQPSVVLTHRLEDRHQDHKLLAELTWNTFRSQLVLEYEIPKFEGDLGQPNFFVGLTEEDITRKERMLMRCFPSQLRRSWFTVETFRALARIRGIESVAPGGYAEAFHVRKLRI